MSNTAFKRDLDDPKTIATFAAQVQSLERLRLLLVLTVADIRAVGPKTWNSWKAALLRELYQRDRARALRRPLPGGARRARAARQAELARHLADWSEQDSEDHFARGPAAYWLAFPPERWPARPAGAPRRSATTSRSPSSPGSTAARSSPRSRSTRRPPRPVRATRRRLGDRRRRHRRCPHLHPHQRQGAGQLLASRTPRAPSTGRKARAARRHASSWRSATAVDGQRELDSQRRLVPKRAASSPSSRAC